MGALGIPRLLSLLLWACLSTSLVVSAIYAPLREYAGSTFFDAWDYYNFYDNTTWGNVTFVDRQTAVSDRLTYVNDAGNAVVKVDNTTFVQNGPLVFRNSVRITSKDTYGIGALIMIDVRHIPYGCSVWPSFWTLGTEKLWPGGGEIDIIEGINMLNNNQIALHTTSGCFQDPNPGQTGNTVERDCSTPRGCLVAENKPNSWGPGFAQAGGGVWALQIDVAGIFVWFWSRPDIPGNVNSANSSSNIDTAAWGPPSASYPAASCNISQYFTPQQLVLLTTLCGTWAGVPSIYASTCHTPTMSCFADNVIGPGSPTYDNAFWEISWIRTYLNSPVPPPGASPNSTTVQSPPSPPLVVPPTTSFVTTTVKVTPPPEPAQSSTSSATLSVTFEHSLGSVLLVFLAWFLRYMNGL
ncbi:glycoside hydrolase family 16 protein [Macrolepiota fuliginosa MF-IS2]|uniref:Glycoside hydrolase family 16 protein n=1 Tax=Macrolepiota fuliginosa MF-IS2 TaxID=1400762 RepID=A0A9P5X3D1_9AGAR|nr:glycoside hydrolase family 16 protein [Macrolepiota fuliginosa MF-IS2]